ncbi:MAG: hypothetical protein WA154_11150 [Moraxellaceae bacterium]
MRTTLIAIIAALLVGIAIGLAAYHHLVRWGPMQETTATFKPGFVQADGSADLTRIPTAPANAGPPPHIIPPKAKEVARARIVVKPKPAAHHPEGSPSDGSLPGATGATCSCEPVVIDISQYLGPDGAGIIASSPDGEVDVSRSTYTPMLEQRPPPRHFALVTAEPGRDAYTGIVGKRWGRVGVGIGMGKQPGDHVRPLLGVEWSW